MKIIHLSNSDVLGGAARATYRIHKSLLNEGVDSRLYVNNKFSEDITVYGPKNLTNKLITKIKPHLTRPLVSLLKTENKILHSPSILPSSWVDRLNQSNADIVHLHWIQKEMISIKDIARIQKPIIWTLHDMWAFCGAEHISWDKRFEKGYSRNNRPKSESGFDLNHYIWAKKKKYWKNKISIITPSNWLKNCAEKSYLMRSWPISKIPNCISAIEWMPVEKSVAREIYQVNRMKPTLVFGTLNANRDKHKGFDLLLESLVLLKKEIKDLQLLIFGNSGSDELLDHGLDIKYCGKLFDDVSIRTLYCTGDAYLSPSRLDNFPNTVLESQILGIPVVAFNVCGLKDLIEHKKTGYLAKPFDTKDFAKGIIWALNKKNDLSLRKYIRQRAQEKWDFPIVSKLYVEKYSEILNKKF